MNRATGRMVRSDRHKYICYAWDATANNSSISTTTPVR